MRLLFERSFTPTYAFSAYYRYLREDFAAHAVLHFGTHGALEFMPGKQSGLSSACWPDRLIGDLPNIYLYAANNPSEGTIAKRRAGATLVSYLTPPLAQAGLYRGLVDLKSSIERWRALAPDASEGEQLAVLIQAQAAAVDLARSEPAWTHPAEAIRQLQRLGRKAELVALAEVLREKPKVTWALHIAILDALYEVGVIAKLHDLPDGDDAQLQGALAPHAIRR